MNAGTFRTRYQRFYTAVLVLLILCVGCAQPHDDASSAPLADGDYLVLVQSVDLETMQVTVDELEWVLDDDQERIAQLGLDPDVDLPGGFYIHNEKEEWLNLFLSEDAVLETSAWESDR